MDCNEKCCLLFIPPLLLMLLLLVIETEKHFSAVPPGALCILFAEVIEGFKQ